MDSCKHEKKYLYITCNLNISTCYQLCVLLFHFITCGNLNIGQGGGGGQPNADATVDFFFTGRTGTGQICAFFMDEWIAHMLIKIKSYESMV